MRLAWIGKRASAALACLALLLVHTGAAQGQCGNKVGAVQPPPQAAGYHQVFCDDFHAFDLSPDGRGSHTWYNGVWFRDKVPPASNFDVSQGYLSVVWRRGQESPESSVTTLSRDAKHFHAWRYGYFEARMKWKPAPGSWPGFWLIPVQDANRSDVYNGERQAGEIDVFEGQGDHPSDFYATIHEAINDKAGPSNSGNNRFTIPRGTDYAQWHRYGVLWEPGRITWYFDGKPIHSEPAYEVFDKQDFYLVFTEQVGADWNYGSLAGVSADEMRLDVQWVKVWQR